MRERGIGGASPSRAASRSSCSRPSFDTVWNFTTAASSARRTLPSLPINPWTGEKLHGKHKKKRERDFSFAFSFSLGRVRPATPESTPPAGSRIEKPAAGAGQGRSPCSQPSGTVTTIPLLLPHQSSSLQLDHHQKSGPGPVGCFPPLCPFHHRGCRRRGKGGALSTAYWPPLKFMPVQSSSFYSPYVPPERNAPVSPSPTSPQLHGVA